MARIRTVKPEFFRHEKLQGLGPLSMLIFEGLWTQCDKAGRFPWKPRTLKLDILPFIDFDMEKELNRLAEHFFVVKYEAQEEFFGVIPTFLDHQRITGKEGLEPAKYPDPPAAKPKKTRKLPVSNQGIDGDTAGTHSGHNGDTIEITGREGKGKGREREEERKGEGAAPPLSDPLFLDSEFQSAWNGWVQWRNKSKTTLTEHAKALNFAELKRLAGDDITLAVKIVNKTVERGWKGFFPLKEDHGNHGTNPDRGRSAKTAREYPEELAL